MSQPSPMQIPQALEELGRALQSVEGKPVDPMTADWAVIERAMARLLGGAFKPQEPNHRGLAILLATALGERLKRDLGGFWFPNRAAPAGAALGFQDAVIVVSPLELVLQALSRAQLSLFEQATKELREALTHARSSQGAGAPKLQPEDYRRLFDPGLVQFLVLDQPRAEAAWNGTAAQAARDLNDALARLPTQLPDDVRRGMKDQLVGTLERFDQGASLTSQVAKAPLLLELVALLHGQREATRFAPAELWKDVLLPLLHIGAAKDLPPLDDEEIEAYKKGGEPLLIFIETVPFQTSAADEDGLLGVFPPDAISLVSPAFQTIPGTRLLRASPEPLAKVCEAFDADALRASLERFTAYLAEKAGGRPATPPKNANAIPLPDLSLALLGDLVQVVKAARAGHGVLCLRRATEAEASSEAAIVELRQALRAGRPS